MFPTHSKYVIIGAGIHGLSTAWGLAKRLRQYGISVDGKITVIDKTGIAAGASGIACGVVKNNYYQPAMRRLMAHSVDIWESEAEALNYHPVGYMQISAESMRSDVGEIYEQQRKIGYESVFIEGEKACKRYMKEIFSDWQAKEITSVLHEKKGGYSNQIQAMSHLASKVKSFGVRVIPGVTVQGFSAENGSDAIASVETDKGRIFCDHIVIAAGPWIRDFWTMLELPSQISLKKPGEGPCEKVNMWQYWQLEEGVLEVSPDLLKTNDNNVPPVIHIDSEATLYSDLDGSVITNSMWGIYYKPDWHFGGIQGGASPYKLDKAADQVLVDPYGPSSSEFVSSSNFALMWVSALAHCHKRFEGTMLHYKKEPSGGIGCFTPDSFPVFDHFRQNVSIIADSNHGWKMIGVGHLIADEIIGEEHALLKPFRQNRFESGQLHPISNSPYPWS